MKLLVTFKYQNPDFSQEYANEYNGGRQDVGNYRDTWGNRQAIK